MSEARRIEPAWITLGYSEGVTLSEKWEMTDKLFKFSPLSKPFTYEMAFRGFKIYGANGSGKTSGFARVIASSFLDHGFGGLVLCAKGDNDEWKNWQNMANEVHRTQSLIEFGPKNKKQKLSFNVLEFVRRMTPDSHKVQANLVEILKLVSSNLKGGKISGSDNFWDDQTDQYLTHLITITLATNPDGQITFHRLAKVFDLIQAGPENILALISDGIDADIERAVNFFTTEFPKINEKTSSIIIASVSSMLFKFNTGILSDLFGNEGNIDPRWCFGGAIIVVNIPVHEFQEIGKTANIIWKYAFQKACLARREHQDFKRPVFLWADEAQEFVHPNDVPFQASSRQARCATVYLTQNIAGLRFGLGSGSAAQDAVKALDATLINTLFHQNIDSETNQYASTMIGTKKEKVISRSSGGFFSSRMTENTSLRDTPIFKQEEFVSLKSGGRSHSKIVESIAFVPGGHFFDLGSLKTNDSRKVSITQGNYKNHRIKSVGKLDPDFQFFLNSKNMEQE